MRLLLSLLLAVSSALAQVKMLSSGITATNLGAPLKCADAVGTDAYACDLAPAPASLASLAGVLLQIQVATANTGASSFAPNSFTAKAIKKLGGGTDTATGDILADETIGLVYNATLDVWILQSPSAVAPSTGTVTDVTGTSPVASSGGATPAISCPTCVTATAAGTSGYNAYFDAAQNVAGDPMFTRTGIGKYLVKDTTASTGTTNLYVASGAANLADGNPSFCAGGSSTGSGAICLEGGFITAGTNRTTGPTIGVNTNTGGISFFHNSKITTNGQFAHWFLNQNNMTATSGATGNVDFSGVTFAPTSGTATFVGIQNVHTINQTGGANGITRGIYVNPTLTAAADYRAIDIEKGVFKPAAYALANLPTTPPAGSMAYCSDCLKGTAVCTTAAGTGTIAAYLNGAWTCF